MAWGPEAGEGAATHRVVTPARHSSFRQGHWLAFQHLGGFNAGEPNQWAPQRP